MSTKTELTYSLDVELTKQLEFSQKYDGYGYYMEATNAWDEDELVDTLKAVFLENDEPEDKEAFERTVTFGAFDFDTGDGMATLTFSVETTDEWMLDCVKEHVSAVAGDEADEYDLTEHKIEVVDGQTHKTTRYDGGKKEMRIDNQLVRREYVSGTVETIDLDTGITHEELPNGTVSQLKNHVRIRDDHPDGRSMVYDKDGRALHGVQKGRGLGETHFENGKITLTITEHGDKVRDVGEEIVVERAWGNTEYYSKASVAGLFASHLQKVVANDGGVTTFKDGYPADGKLHYAAGHACTFRDGKAIDGTKALDEYVNQCGYLANSQGRKLGLQTYVKGQLVWQAKFHSTPMSGRFVGITHEKNNLHRLIPPAQRKTVKGLMPHTLALYDHLPPAELAVTVVDSLKAAGVEVSDELTQPVADGLSRGDDPVAVVLDGMAERMVEQMLAEFAPKIEVAPAPTAPKETADLTHQGPKI